MTKELFGFALLTGALLITLLVSVFNPDVVVGSILFGVAVSLMLVGDIIIIQRGIVNRRM